MAETLRYARRLSKGTADKQILALARWGDGGGAPDAVTDDEIRSEASRVMGKAYGRILEDVRDGRFAPFQNLIGSAWTVSAGVGTPGHATLPTTNGHVSGTAVTATTYWSLFEAALAARSRAVETDSIVEFALAATAGVGSVEGLINAFAARWNARCSEPGQQLIDSREEKVSLDDKFNRWIPAMSAGSRLDKSGPEWEHFKLLRTLRDHVAVHPKAAAFRATLADLANTMNLFPQGVAGMLLLIHKHFAQPTPSVIIRCLYGPVVEVANVAQVEGGEGS